MNRCGSFPLFSAPHSLFSIWTNLKRSEKIPGAPTSRWGEWIWLTGPSGLHQNSPQGLNISSIRVFDKIRDPEMPITLHPQSLVIIVSRWKLHLFLPVASCDDVSGCSTPVSMQLLDLGSILVAYKQVQHTHLHHVTPLISSFKTLDHGCANHAIEGKCFSPPSTAVT